MVVISGGVSRGRQVLAYLGHTGGALGALVPEDNDGPFSDFTVGECGVEVCLAVWGIASVEETRTVHSVVLVKDFRSALFRNENEAGSRPDGCLHRTGHPPCP